MTVEMAVPPLCLPELRGCAGLVLALVSGVFVGIVAVWVDPDGRVTLTNRDGPVEGAARVEPGEVASEWERTGIRGTPIPARDRDSSREEDRLAREIRVLLFDLVLGDAQRAVPVLRRLHRKHPGHPEIALALAEVERDRGRPEAGRRILDSLLTTVGSLHEPWAARARELALELDEEIELQELPTDGNLQRVVVTDQFQLTYDHRLANRAYGEVILRILERTRLELARSLGRTLPRPLSIHLYSRSQYLDAYRHRFGFATVGFYDGAIHAVAARHPRTELHALLTHEYSHALFRDALRSDEPFFLNEGIAEREEQRVRGQTGLVRSEWWKLVEAIRTKNWIPLDRLVAGFGEFEDEQALLAYLEARAAVELIDERYPGALIRWLDRCARGSSWEFSLLELTGWNVRALDRAVQREVASRFPRLSGLSAGEARLAGRRATSRASGATLLAGG
ncbi:MAG: tetratricopeptide repeat protein [Myxococcota bacterium]